jgi:predicted secreted protein
MPYIVQTASAKMPSSCRGKYIRVAVLEVDDGIERASMISRAARGVRRVVQTWERCSVGKTARSASAQAIAEAQSLASELNAAIARAPT